jgi:hypothetical protein
VLENKMLRRIFGWGDYRKMGENCMMRDLIICTLYLTLGLLNHGACNTHRRDSEMYIKVWSENLEGRDLVEDKVISVVMTLKLIFKKCSERKWAELTWLGIGNSDQLL